MNGWKRGIGVVVLVALLAAPAARAEDAYYRVLLQDLTLTEGKLPQREQDGRYRRWEMRDQFAPYVVLDGPGEGYARYSDGWTRPAVSNDDRGRDVLLVRAPSGKDVAGRLYLPTPRWDGMVMVRFVVPASAAGGDARKPFLEAKAEHFRALVSRGLPGAAWFRHELRLAEKELSKTPSGRDPDRTWNQWQREGEFTRTYELFTGGRALRENLQLDRLLPPAPRADETPVKVDSIRGITIAEIDWQQRTKDLQPKLDPLATYIPADQHAVFFPSFRAATQVSDEADRHGTPVLALAGTAAENQGISQRYQRQLGLPLSDIARLLGPSVIKSMAVTGSDPYFPTGTDVAVLFEAVNPTVLEGLLRARVQIAAAEHKQVATSRGEAEGVTWHALTTADRTLSNYVARVKDAVVVTNSLAQLKRLAAVASGKEQSIASLPEYVFFRDRYKLGDADEQAFIFLSDATIRRWCSPRWRIADSRRTRDAAVMSDIQAAYAEKLVKKQVEAGPVHTDLPLVGGELRLGPQGVSSSTMGSLEFMTPIIELPLDTVTKAEAEAYERWRDGYERNWNWAFDPIGLRVTLAKNQMGADLTVMPLIAGTRYRELMEIVGGAKIAPDSGDPHDALVHLALAIDPKSRPVNSAADFASHMTKGLSLGWLGRSLAVWADDDPFWTDLAKVKEDELDKFMERNVGRLPLGLRIEVSNGLRLTAFLAALRAFVDQTAPDMTIWESFKYKDRPYVRVSGSETAKSQRGLHGLENLAIYYAPSADCLLVALREDVLKRAIDRQLARKDKAAPQPASHPWLGESVALQIDAKAVEMVSRLMADHQLRATQQRAWNNLPILNVWKRMFPDRDPVAVHRQLWHTELVSPGGGRYVWNDQWQTMESADYGCPAAPKAGPVAPLLEEFRFGSFGLTLADQALRARVVLEKKPAAKAQGKVD